MALSSSSVSGIDPFLNPKDYRLPAPWTSPIVDIGYLLWMNCKIYDFKIVTRDGRVLLVHKCVLAARSPVFYAMLTSGMTEVQSGQLNIQDFDFYTVQEGIFYCYSKGLTINIKPSSIWNLLSFGNKYDIQHLIGACLYQINLWRKSFDTCSRMFLIKSAFNLGCDQILDSILNSFVTINGKILPNACPYRVNFDLY